MDKSQEINPLTNEEKINNLPDDVREAMFSVESGDIIREVAEKNKLHVDQGGALARETGKLMMGETAPSIFINQIKKEVRVDNDTAKKIAEEINVRIFKPIRQSLKAMYGVGENAEADERGGPTEDTPSRTPPTPQTTSGQDPYREVIEESDRYP